jgi:hypothetical protein
VGAPEHRDPSTGAPAVILTEGARQAYAPVVHDLVSPDGAVRGVGFAVHGPDGAGRMHDAVEAQLGSRPVLSLPACAGLAPVMGSVQIGRRFYTRPTAVRGVVEAPCVNALPLRFLVETPWSNIVRIDSEVTADHASAGSTFWTAGLSGAVVFAAGAADLAVVAASRDPGSQAGSIFAGAVGVGLGSFALSFAFRALPTYLARDRRTVLYPR